MAKAILALGLLAALPAHAATCSSDALSAFHVPGVTITTATPVAATAAEPSHCRVDGAIATHGEGVPDGSAHFELALPDAWQRRLLVMGNGGNAGSLQASTNTVDRAAALPKGYATIVSDTGHTGGTFNASFVVDAQGHRDPAKVTDFFYRATHDVTETAKRLVHAYYGADVSHAYFDGCSTGGRMAMMEAERYPQDFDGVISGDPAMDYRSNITRLSLQKWLLSTPDAWIPPALLKVVDQAVMRSCDATDGTKDGLIQDPRRCVFHPQTLQCAPGQSADCLSPVQVQTLTTYLQPVRDSKGTVLYPSLPATNLSGPSGMSLWGIGKAAPDLAHVATPWMADPDASPEAWRYGSQVLAYWLGEGEGASFANFDVDPKTGIVSDAALAAFDRAYDGINTRDPQALEPFLRAGKKIIFYHGFSDPGISPFRTIAFMDELSAHLHGDAAAANAALFLVPGMHHCRAGAGPNQFDTLTALEQWVEHGVAPDAILAKSSPDQAIQRTMPLCRYPEEAKYDGTGDMTAASSWSCSGGKLLSK